MNNLNNYLDVDKINYELEKAGIQKSRLISNIYREYEVYLYHVRDLIYISVEKGLNELINHLSIKDNFLDANEFSCVFEKKIIKLISANLPFLTVEQLKINEIEKNKNKIIYFNNSGSPINTKNDQKEEMQYEYSSQFQEPIQFLISNDISNASEYYQTDNNEKFISINLDNNFFTDNNTTENIGVEKQFISSLRELIEGINVEKARYLEKEYIDPMEVSPTNDGLKYFDLIDRSLENLLLNLSYKINQELFKANLIKKIISKDSFEYLIDKKLMIKHLHPFVINFELNINKSSSIFYLLSTQRNL